MKLLLAHNFYQRMGGEDLVFEDEKHLLRAAGHEVTEYIRLNSEIANYGLSSGASLGPRAVWAWDTVRQLRHILAHEKPSIAHFHNTFPLISPAAYYACHTAGAAVVQTLHNYRLLCPAGTLYRQGRVCEECIEHSVWRAVRYGCYRGSRPASVVASLMVAVHRWRQTWTQMVDCYVTPSSFARKKFVDAGLPAEKIFVKPNFVYPDPGPRNYPGDYVLFVGRILTEKGLDVLLRAWKLLPNGITLRIVGDGPALASLKAKALQEGLSTVSFEGQKTRSETIATIKGARFLVFPSEWYETFGRAIIEAFACGVPVLTSRLGAMEELVEDGRTGMHMTHGNPDDLADKIAWAWNNPHRLEEMGRQARAEYEAKYTADRNYQMLQEIYQKAVANRWAAPCRSTPEVGYSKA